MSDDEYAPPEYRASRTVSRLSRVFHYKSSTFSTRGDYRGSVRAVALFVSGLGLALCAAVVIFSVAARFR